MANGHIELDRTVDSIRVGHRHRQDLGDVDELAASIRQLGLIQPITISPDGTLICGARRLAAVKALGWNQVNVWVRSGVSTELQRLLAEQHENVHRKPLTPTEAAGLYRELKTLMAEDAARRQQATRFGHNDMHRGRSYRAATVAAPAGVTGDARAQAAAAVTGTRSYTTLERVGEIERIAADPALPEPVRQLATAEIAAMDADGTVAGHYDTAKAAALTAELEQLAHDPDQPRTTRDRAAAALRTLRHDTHPAARLRVAQTALRNASARHGGDSGATDTTPSPSPSHSTVRAPKQYGVRAFVLTWAELDGWTTHYDTAEIGPALTPDQWARFQATVEATVAFAEAARLARAD